MRSSNTKTAATEGRDKAERLKLKPGMDLAKAIRRARDMGAKVGVVRRSGEVKFSHTLMTPLRVDGHRKDSPRCLYAWLKRLSRRAGLGAR